MSASIALVSAKIGWGGFAATGCCSDCMPWGKGATPRQRNGGKACNERGIMHLAPDIGGGQDRGKIGWKEWETFNIQHPTSKGENVTSDRRATEEETKQEF
jgi:hypothetical protein